MTDAPYPDEDCTPTSRRELLGFYLYQCALEVVAIAGVGSFLPITLEDLARGSGVLVSDHSTPCVHSPHSSSSLSPRYENSLSHSLGHLGSFSLSPLHLESPLLALSNITSTISPRDQKAEDPASAQCVIYLGSLEINTASFAMYVFALSVALQVLVVVTMSGAADHGSYRKSLLLGFAVVGAATMCMFILVDSRTYLLGALFAIIANVCLGASAVLLNAYLPLLVRRHPRVNVDGRMSAENQVSGVQMRPTSSDGLLEDTASDPLLEGPSSVKSPTAESTELMVSTQISAYGYGFGYLAALVVQLVCIAIILLVGPPSALRVVLFVIGAFWLFICAPVARFLRPRPGPPLHISSHSSIPSITLQSKWAYMTHSWRSLSRTLLRARRQRDLFLFLCAWFLLSDAIATVSGTAVLFAKTSLGMSPAELSLISITTTIFGVIGAFAIPGFAEYMLWSPTRTLCACILLFETIPIYGLLPYIPAIKRAGVGGLQQPWELHLLAAVYGLVLGGIGSFSRSLYGELIPVGSGAAFYALFAVTDKGSSVIGPTVVGIITDATGEIRGAFWFLAILILVPLVPMRLVDVERGKKDAVAAVESVDEE